MVYSRVTLGVGHPVGLDKCVVTGTHRESREESTVLQVLITPPSSSPHPPRVSILLPFSDPQVPLQASSKVVQSPEGGSL